MKKTIFTFCSIAAVCCAIFFACAKDDNSITHVGYVSQTPGGTGGNPNPNGLPSNSGYGTTTATTGTTTSGSTTSTTSTNTNTTSGSGSLTANSTTTNLTVSCSTTGGFYVMSGSDGTNQVIITFASKPVTSGTFPIGFGAPTAGSCEIQATISGTSYAGNTASGNVTVNVTGGTVTATFSGVNLSNVSGGGTIPLSGHMGC